MADPRSSNRNYPVPSTENTIEQDFLRLIELVGLLDVDLATVIAALAGKAATEHDHAIDDITGLATALSAKAAANHNHALSGLSDVTATGAPVGTVLVKTSGGWQAGGLDAAIIQSGTIDAARLPTLTTGLAPLASPAFSGTPSAPTPAPGTNTTQLATTAFVAAAAAALVASSPATLDTLNELAAALGNDANFATTVTTALGNKQPLSAVLTAFAALAWTSGDLLYAGAAGALARLPKGSDGQILTLASGLPSWAAAPATGVAVDNGALAVGSFALLRKTNSGSVNSGSTINGSNLSPSYYQNSGAAWTNSGSASGSWRNVSGITITQSDIGLFQRIS
ncbi:hypothetical protein [Prosthecodimorpha staleyi]|uniref:Bacteriophage tail fiber protein n=1 Tax=Prosthecodimorpha staleyi TaxID=2840188 RepID=A0A947D8W9_9HYPH|nr:hypothetical protein [Prosthecodimorpha staleyi]MBT9293295.1 hypothetical protein [Prosthecodimorpha staleyi]